MAGSSWQSRFGDPEVEGARHPDTSPTQIVSPLGMNIDLGDLHPGNFNPKQYMSMLAEGMGNMVGPEPPERGAPTTKPFAGLHEEVIHPESKPIITAIETGYAHPKIMSPIKAIRDAIATGDEDALEKGHKKLVELYAGQTSFSDRFADYYLRKGEHAATAHKIASDIVMAELQRADPKETPSAEEAVTLGLLQPNELLPDQQPSPTFANLIPQEPFTMGEDNMPVSSVQPSMIPAQPGQQPSGMLYPEEPLRPLQRQYVEARMKAKTKGKEHADPAGLQEFHEDVQAQVDAHKEKHGVLPDKQTYSGMVAAARKRVTEEPIKGGLQEDMLKVKIAAEKAGIDKTKEQTTTERLMRPEQLKETQAKTAELLSKMNLNITEASRAVTKGLYAEFQAKIESARAGMSELKSQMQIVSTALAGTDLTKEDKLKYDQYLLDMVKSGLEISRRGGVFGLDFFDPGNPNINLKRINPAGSNVPVAPELGSDGLTMIPPANTGVNPVDFAPGSRSITPQPQAQPMSEEPTPDEKAEYFRLRKAGKTKEQAEKLMKKKAK